jgi:hypothetical protein
MEYEFTAEELEGVTELLTLKNPLEALKQAYIQGVEVERYTWEQKIMYPEFFTDDEMSALAYNLLKFFAERKQDDQHPSS